jgi:hypothetical protein
MEVANRSYLKAIEMMDLDLKISIITLLTIKISWNGSRRLLFKVTFFGCRIMRLNLKKVIFTQVILTQVILTQVTRKDHDMVPESRISR